MKQFLCVEDNEQFVVEAESLEQAQEDVVVYNASVIGEIKNGKVTIQC